MTRTIKAYFQTILILLSLAACTNPVPQIDEDSDVAIIVDAAVDSRSDRAQDDSADAAEAAVEASVDDSDASATEDSDASGDAQDGGNQRDSQADAVVMDGSDSGVATGELYNDIKTCRVTISFSSNVRKKKKVNLPSK